MRILIISFHFPPYNTIGAVRVGKHAKYLEASGHQVRVVTAGPQAADDSLPLEVPSSHVHRTTWVNVNRLVDAILGGREAVARSGYSIGAQPAIVARVARALGATYKTLVHVPDGQIGWYLPAVREARRIVGEWRPDLIFASSSPPTSLLVAAAVARAHAVPWVAELRDLWLDNANRQFGAFRNALEADLERRTLTSAAGLVTVSEPLAEALRRKFGRPTRVVLNGYDMSTESRAPAPLDSDPNCLHLVYTGRLYEGRQDPSELFKAMRHLDELQRRVRVTFVGRYLDGVTLLARRYGVENQVRVARPLPYEDALQLQRDSDVLLLLLWTDPKQTGIYTGKLFEYIGARRPILAVGRHPDAAANLITDRRLGVVASDAEHIGAQLQLWLARKAAHGTLPPPDATAIDDLSREAQTRKLAEFFTELVATGEG